MCGWIGKGNFASSPARMMILRAVVGVIGPPRAKRTQLGAADRVRRRQVILQSRHLHQAGLEINLLPAHRHELRDPQPMPIGKEDERPIARTVAAHLAGGLQELLDLRRR